MIFNKIKQLKDEGKIVGITFSTFDMLHAGHIAMLSEAKNHCDYLIMRGAMKLTKLEVDALKNYNRSNNEKGIVSLVGSISTENKREQNEWQDKAKQLGYEV